MALDGLAAYSQKGFMQALGLEHDMKRVLFLIALPCLAVSSVGLAQLPTFIPGARVRVETSGARKIEGAVTSQTTDSITIATVGTIRIVVPSASITRIWVGEAKSRSQGAIRGMITGLGAGPIVGFMASLVSGWELFLPVTALYAAVGAAGGAAYGAMKGSERWHTVYSGPRVVGQP